jgi:anthranilate synthase component II
MILVIDNYDSFTYNLVQLLAGLGVEVTVRRNDAVTLDQVAVLDPAAIVLSPGPCGPHDAGISVEAVRRFGGSLPILGVCLGHQAIGVAYGGRVLRAGRPVHGKVSRISHLGDEIFRELPDPVEMTRYHSLVLDPDSLPPDLVVTAWTEDERDGRVVQGIRHRRHRVWGVQFHPESIASRHGDRLLANFLELAA